MKIVSIVGKKNSGKTSLTVKVIKELKKRGYKVATIKHSHHTIEMDKENTDTWKHKQAGSELVVGVGSTTFFNVKKDMDLNRILYLIKHLDEVDYVVIEGFKSYNYPKIITSPEIKDEYTICEIDSFTIDEEGINDLVNTIEEKSHDMTDTLFSNSCGFNNGDAIAAQIRNGNMKTENLDNIQSYLSVDEKVVGLNRFVSDYLKQTVYGIIKTLNLKDYGVEKIGKIEVVIPDADYNPQKEKKKTEIEINSKPLMINKFTNDMITNTIKSMINSLKTPENAKTVTIEITNIIKGTSNADISVQANNKDLTLNEFSQKILKDTIYALICTLKTQDDINRIKINLKNDCDAS